MEDKLSTLEVAKLADVLVVEGNPLEGFDALSSAVSPPQAKWSSGQRSLPGPPRRQGNADLWPVVRKCSPAREPQQSRVRRWQGNADLWSAPLREAQRKACTAEPPG